MYQMYFTRVEKIRFQRRALIPKGHLREPVGKLDSRISFPSENVRKNLSIFFFLQTFV